MNNILKYVLFLIAILFSISCWSNSESTLEEETIKYEVQMDMLSSEEEPSNDYGLCPSNSSNISLSGAELLRTLKRFENLRYTFTFIKADRVINVGVKCLLQETSINFHSLLSEPNYKLIRLKKLVI